MPGGITHSNKDVLFKVLEQLYKDKSLAVYGLDIPKIKRMLPSSFPAVTATEVHADNLFLLEDDSLYLQEYESTVSPDDGIKYAKYICAAVEMLKKEGVKVKNVIIGVIYTGDIVKAPAMYDFGALYVKVNQVFLSKFDSNALYGELKAKIDKGETLTDEDALKLIILPLTQKGTVEKQKLTKNAVELAKMIEDERQQIFCIAAILVASDKFIEKEYSNQIKEWIGMTKVARLFEEEKIEAVSQAQVQTREEIAIKLLTNHVDIKVVMESTGLTFDEVMRLKSKIKL